MAAWPATLPEPLLAGNGVEPRPNVIRTDMEAGPARHRRRSTAVLTRMRVSWLLEPAQMVTFLDWWSDDLHDGVEWFTATLDVGAGDQAFNARFVEPYQAEPRGLGRWVVAGELELEAV